MADAPNAALRLLPLASITEAKSVDQQPAEDGIAFMRMDELVGVRLFAKMKVRRDSVLKKMDQQISDEDEERRSTGGDAHTFWDHLHDGGREHEAGTESDEVAEICALPVLLHNDESAKNVGRRRRQAKHHTEKDGVHSELKDSRGQRVVICNL
jgi:hypothetical protein